MSTKSTTTETPEQKIESLRKVIANLEDSLNALRTYNRENEALVVWPGEEDMTEEQLEKHWTFLRDLYSRELEKTLSEQDQLTRAMTDTPQMSPFSE